MPPQALCLFHCRTFSVSTRSLCGSAGSGNPSRPRPELLGQVLLPIFRPARQLCRRSLQGLREHGLRHKGHQMPDLQIALGQPIDVVRLVTGKSLGLRGQNGARTVPSAGPDPVGRATITAPITMMRGVVSALTTRAANMRSDGPAMNEAIPPRLKRRAFGLSLLTEFIILCSCSTLLASHL